MPKKELFLLDAYALIFRAYYALGNNFLYNSKDLNVTAIMGFTRTMHNLIEKESPTHMAVVFDHKSQTFRSKDFEYYKANRDETPEDIKISEPIIREIIKAYNIPILEVEGFEADDVIGTLAKQKSKEGYDVYMVTPDKDFAQLVDENIFIWKPGRKGNTHEILGIKEVLEQWDISRPDQVIDVLAMWGDAVDNIPGIPGIGKKTAPKLLKEFDTIEGLLANTEKLKGKQKENVENNRQQALDSKHLATIITDVPISCEDKDLHIDPMNKEKLAELFTELEFRTLGQQILGSSFSVNTDISSNRGKKEDNSGQMSLFGSNAALGETADIVADQAGKNIENTNHKYLLVDSEDEILKLIAELEKVKEFTFDTETTGLNDLNTELVGISFAIEEGKAWYVPIPEDQDKAHQRTQLFKNVFENTAIGKAGQNLKFDINVLSLYGIQVKGQLFDTMVAHYVLEPDKRHNLNYLSETFLGYTPVPIEELIGKKGKNQLSFREIDVQKAKEYAGEDADITFQLQQKLQPIIQEDEANTTVFKQIEMPLVPVLARMEQSGVKLNREFLEDFSQELTEEIKATQEWIYNEAGTEFNLDSPKQLGEILFDHLKIPYKGKKTKTGQYSTNEATLTRLDDDHEIIQKVLDYRQIAKLKSTYVDALPELINPRTGRLHTTFQQAVAATGRLSSINPNLQNIPIRTERGRRVRKAFVPRDENHSLLAVDYSQIELRLVAHLSGDEMMIDAFNNGLDIHTLTASKVFDVAESEVTREMRSNAKTVNFGIIYGVSAFGLSQQTDLSRTESKEIIDSYFATYPQLKKYMDGNIDFARKHGYVETIMGRKRYLPDINSNNRTVRGHAERNAINAPVQGSAADLVKMAMIAVDDELQKQQLQSVMTLQVHDELVFDVLNSELEQVKEIVCDKMEQAMPGLSVKMVAEPGVGQNWLEAH